MASRTSVILLLLVCLCGHPLAGEEIRADWSETLLQTSGVVRIYRGAVSLRDTAGSVYISADSAHAWIPSDTQEKGSVADRYLFVGGVSLQDSARRVRADTLAYDPGAETAAFRGGVTLEDAGRRLTARRVVYRLREGRIEATGGVEMAYPTQGIWVRTGALWYRAEGDSGMAAGDTEVLRTPAAEEGDTLRVSADTLRFSGQGDDMRFSGRVRVTPRAGVRAGCAISSYSKAAGRMEMLGHPYVGWTQETASGRDSVWAAAGRLLLGFEDERLATLELLDSARVRTEPCQSQSRAYRTVRADTCVVAFLNGEIARLQAGGGVEASLRSEDGSEISLRGENVRMVFNRGDLDSIAVEGKGSVAHRPAGGKVMNQISGRWISMAFFQKKIKRILIVDEAACKQTGDLKGERIDLTGDRLNLTFEDGKLQKAVGEGGISGRYVPAEKERKR